MLKNESLEKTQVEEKDVVKKNEPHRIKTGVVNCKSLSVRQYPDVETSLVTVILENTEVKIDETKSNNEWFAVCTTTGINGYCMKKFVDVKQ